MSEMHFAFVYFSRNAQPHSTNFGLELEFFVNKYLTRWSSCSHIGGVFFSLWDPRKLHKVITILSDNQSLIDDLIRCHYVRLFDLHSGMFHPNEKKTWTSSLHLSHFRWPTDCRVDSFRSFSVQVKSSQQQTGSQTFQTISSVFLDLFWTQPLKLGPNSWPRAASS